MAYPRDLVRAISEAFGVSEATVALHDRLLLEQGYRRKGGRGRSAAQVTPEDAASLAIAIAGAPVSGPAVSTTIRTYREYSQLVAVEPNEPLTDGDWKPLNLLPELPPGHDFRSAIAGLIRAYADGEMGSVYRLWNKPELASGDPGYVVVSIEVDGPIAAAQIKIEALPGADGHPADFPPKILQFESPESLKFVRAAASENPRRGRVRLSHTPDLHQKRTFGEQTLGVLAPLFQNAGKQENAW